MAERVTRAEAEPQALKQTPCGLCRVLRGSPCGDAGADGGTRTRDLFLTKEVLYLLSYISVSMILTVCGDLRLPAFLPLAGVTKEVLYLLSYISMADDAAFRAGSRRRMLYDYMFSPRLCQRNSGSRPRFFGGRGEGARTGGEERPGTGGGAPGGDGSTVRRG